jgi:hypothetical protein
VEGGNGRSSDYSQVRRIGGLLLLGLVFVLALWDAASPEFALDPIELGLLLGAGLLLFSVDPKGLIR